MKRGDLFIAIGMVVIALIVLAVPYLAPKDRAAMVVVTANSIEVKRLPLATANETFSVDGYDGKTEVSIAGGKARILTSDCPDQRYHNFPIDRPGQSLICLPNRVVVRVEGSTANQDFDLIVH